MLPFHSVSTKDCHYIILRILYFLWILLNTCRKMGMESIQKMSKRDREKAEQKKEENKQPYQADMEQKETKRDIPGHCCSFVLGKAAKCFGVCGSNIAAVYAAREVV